MVLRLVLRIRRSVGRGDAALGHVIRFTLASVSALSLLGAGTQPPRRALSTPVVANATNRFTVTGMHCDGCAKGIASELKRAAGVATATVSFTNKVAVVAYDTNRTTVKALQKVIVEAGYGAKPLRH